MTRISVTAKIAAGLEAVRLDGRANMLDRRAVQRIAYDLEEWETVGWIEEHIKEYGAAIMGGFDIEPGTASSGGIR